MPEERLASCHECGCVFTFNEADVEYFKTTETFKFYHNQWGEDTYMIAKIQCPLCVKYETFDELVFAKNLYEFERSERYLTPIRMKKGIK